MRRITLALLALSACHAAPSTGPAIYVSDEASNVVHVIDAAALALRMDIAVGRRPRGMVLSPDRRRLYVASGGDSRVDVIDLDQNRVLPALPSGPDPETITLSPDGSRLYVANEDDNLLSIVDIAAGRLVAKVPVGGEPEGTAASPDGRLVVQTSETASMAHVIDARTAAVIDNLIVDTRPRFVAFEPGGRRFWVSSEVRATVTAFDTATRRPVGRIDFNSAIPGERPSENKLQAVAIAFTRGGDRAFVALGRARLVAELDPRTLALVRTFPVGWRAWNLALSPDGRRLYTANGLSGDMSVVDLVQNRPAGTIRLGGRPWGVVAR
ncbi:PQQ-dependent catabolism-associated beta-propeller protein [Sphingomonas quercus]|uniref:PQQ-dependent catabolism-associated beta-propeller protein n=1 Tax=Sphingomonas quercus TaxID=2842451 RepID=A0ABS6BGL3_9SPHN|nr:PQQ-dependent catabolism-associated beta-propeller protein [Sphingomonas quercus]MBU3077314.1 PQQ-dependent catabolism-associated beta-propeller protein [Sphingomonas quercus]